MRNRTGVWFGWSGDISDEPAAQPRFVQRNRVAYAVIDLSDRFPGILQWLANRVLWPILHYRVDLQEYSRADRSGYMRVNRRFADSLDLFIEDDDIIWVHDYHLMPLARELRARGRLNPIGFYLHIPCAPPDILQTLPHHEDILGSLTYYDLVGFQTENDRDNFAHYLTSLGAKPGRGRSYWIDGRQTRIGAFPVGIETAVYARLARNAARSPFVKKSPRAWPAAPRARRRPARLLQRDHPPDQRLRSLSRTLPGMALTRDVLADHAQEPREIKEYAASRAK